jgi:ubiquinone/menaquinone biosynthesis C-methylase UbiE
MSVNNINPTEDSAALAAVEKILEANSRNLIELIGQISLDLAQRLDHAEARLLEQIMLQRMFLQQNTSPGVGQPAPLAKDTPTLDEAFARLRAAAPLNWEQYQQCLNSGTESYEGLPAVSCSTESHPQSQLFKAFLRPYLRGYVLDIGCGPQPVPSYLGSFPHKQIVGIDPISRQNDHPFRFVSGVGEFLPFDDEVFDVAVSGTTLDHYYLLDKGLAEAARVLRRGGHFVAWITEFAGAPEYDPYSAKMTPYDSEHMYHIDRQWFVPLMDRLGFSPAETVHFKLPFNFLFMSFVKR